MRFYNTFFRAAALLLCVLVLIARPVDASDDAELVDGAQLDTRGLHFKRNYFHVQVYRSGRKYHSSKGSWIAFHGGDGYVVDNIQEAERFYIFAGQLITSKGHYVHLEFSNGYAIFKWESKRQRNGIWYSTKPLPPPTHKPTKKPTPPWTTKGPTSTKTPKPTTTKRPPPTTTKGPQSTKTSYTTTTKPPTTMTTATTSTTKVTTGTVTTTTVETTTTTTTTTSANPSWDPDPDMHPRDVETDPEEEDYEI
ncbi:hypothetical protein B0A52_02159 [Exophiala mesophila]|uniref:DUF7908 domain-containing protein n=1 Tax=Exophiala mesophila TaxID=212818 RepID=A0A438NB90_EXOME|nr:hypothetical protein B0A52_02159 [Exophiala mesophila]